MYSKRVLNLTKTRLLKFNKWITLSSKKGKYGHYVFSFIIIFKCLHRSTKFHELSLCKTHLLEIKSRGIETFFVQTLLAFTKYEDRLLLLPIRAIQLRWPPPCYMHPPLIFEKIWCQGASEFNDSDSLLLSLFFFFRIRSFDNFTTNENLDHKENMPKYDHILSEVDGLHGRNRISRHNEVW